MNTTTHKVRFTVTYEATIEVVEGESLEDAISDIDIPENATCTYVPNSFQPKEV